MVTVVKPIKQKRRYVRDLRKHEVQDIFQMRYDGHTYDDIGRRHGLTATPISRILSRELRSEVPIEPRILEGIKNVKVKRKPYTRGIKTQEAEPALPIRRHVQLVPRNGGGMRHEVVSEDAETPLDGRSNQHLLAEYMELNRKVQELADLKARVTVLLLGRGYKSDQLEMLELIDHPED